MPSLMTIPRELRDQICEYVILSPARQPPSLDQTAEELLDGYVTYKNPKVFSGPGASYQPRASVSNAGKLLLVNQHLRAETTEMLERMRSNVVYDLDIVMTEDGIMAATWISIPFLTSEIEQLNVTFRFCVTNDSEQLKSRLEDMSEAPANPRPEDFFGLPNEQLIWDFYSVLERFTHVGPLGERNTEAENQHFTIKRININVKTPSLDLVQLGLTHMADQAKTAMSFSSGYFLVSLNWTVRQQLIGNWEYRRSMVLLEHVDDIMLYRDGDEEYYWDVATWLAEYSEYEVTEWRAEGKKEAWRVRRDRGLKVPENFDELSRS